MTTINLAQKRAYFKEVGYEPHGEGQWNIHNSSARFRIPCCGRRWGKSQSCGHEMGAHLFIPDTYWWIVGPTYPLGEKEFRVIHHDLVHKLRLGHKLRITYNVKQGDMTIRLPWNTVLEVKSAAHPDSLVGEGLDGVIMSEAALHKQATWEQYIEPALSDKRGWALFPSTPRGFNWYKGLYELGQDPDEPDYESWRFPTWTNRINYPSGRNDTEIKRIERIVSEFKFQQEYGAEFTSFEGKIYPEFKTETHVKRIQYNPNWLNYMVFDFGWSAPFVCLDIMVDPSDNIYVWREYQERFKTTYEHGIVLKNRPSPVGYHVDGMYGDPHGADERNTLALVLGYVEAPDVPWEDGIQAVKSYLKLQPDGTPKLFIDPSCSELIRQMEMLQAPEQKDGKNPREGQKDWDDHGPDALRYFFAGKVVLGMGMHLADVYRKKPQMTEAQTFFQNHSKVTLGATRS